MSLLVMMPTRDPGPVLGALSRLAPELAVAVWPEVPDPGGVEVALCWQHPHGALAGFPRLEVAMSFGAGVEHLLADPGLPAGVTVSRFVDERLVADMAEYVLAAVLAWRRGWALHRDAQHERAWRPRAYPRSNSVLVLGLGRLGAAAALRLAANGLDVVGWSRTPHALPGVRCVHGAEGLDAALPGADVVVCMLPLTAATAGILDRDLLGRMRPGGYLVNVGRGAHLVEKDLLAALGSEMLAGACLDVFAEEPLPREHPFWGEPRITVTPHVASLTDPEAVARQAVATVASVRAGQLPPNPVDRERGY